MARKIESSAGLWLVAAFKLFKGIVLLAVGLGTLRLLHKDTAMEIDRWADIFRVDPQNHYLHALLAKTSLLTDKKLEEFSIGTFFYSALLLTEGTGLALRKRWAEYFTIISTGVFIPLELYEIIKRNTYGKLLILFLNIAVVVYLIFELRRSRHLE